ncbi:MAG: homocysteine S-methyltransferase family protein [Victivallales bacterium]|nr:homocysteine S-methyltransferase family protein [Victivallales bacterium]
MKKQDFLKLIRSKITFLDGATGTELAKLGMPHGVCPEAWVIEHPDSIATIQKNYEAAGSDIVYACTFGANPIKLANYGFEKDTVAMNRRLAEISKAAMTKALVFGDISSTGRFIEPFDDDAMPFEEAVNVYKEQVRGLLEGGVDGFAIETMMDIQETRAALIAVRELDADIPVIVTMTFEQNGRTLTGNSPISSLITLQALGATAFGCNCSTGPEHMVEIIKAMKPYARIPLVAKPNAGMPKLEGEKTVYDLTVDDFAPQLKTLVDAGASIVGGCCGTSPAYIAAASKLIAQLPPPPFGESTVSCVSSPRKFRVISPEQPFAIVGERINPTGKKALQAELREGKFDLVLQYAEEQVDAGAEILDVNVGVPNIDEVSTMKQIIAQLLMETHTPLCIDTTKPEVAEAALRLYPGRVLFNSISAEKERLEAVLPIAAKYGAMIVVLPLDDAGIPDTVEKRAAVATRIMDEASQYGYEKRDFVVDGLVMTVSSNPHAAQDTLALIQWAASNHLNTICGLSNVSFGLPRRDLINRAFMAMAIGAGLNCAIANPMLADMIETVKSGDVLMSKDEQARCFIEAFAGTEPNHPKMAAAAVSASAAATTTLANTPKDMLRHAVINGNDSLAANALQKCLDEHMPPQEIVNDILIPAISVVGEKYERKEFFLPQLLGAAKTMRNSMATLEPLLAAAHANASGTPAVPFILATVKGDIHDIGKNIVAVMLRNYNFNVIDLGRDVPADTILDAAVANNAKIIGLSALMTTTMTEMKTVIETAKERGLNDLKFIVGGAVVTDDYAQSIGAFYAKDAMDTVRIAQKLS